MEEEHGEGGPSDVVEPRRGGREKTSRLMLINGQTVLRQNNYDIDSFRSVAQEMAEKKTPASSNFTIPDGYEVNTFGQVAKKRPLAQSQSIVTVEKVAKERKIDPVIGERRAWLVNDKDAKEEKRLRFIARHIEKIRPFLNSASSLVRQIDEVLQNEGTPSPPPKKRYEVQPSCISSSVEMRPYQLEGLDFMMDMYNNGMSCILADEMGLGKTLQTISFIGSLMYDYNACGPFLVVVPLSVLSNWLSEFSRFCSKLKVVRFHISDVDEKQRVRQEM